MSFNPTKYISLSPQSKQLIENVISLSLVQGTNYLLPLITLPYLVRVLGPEKFGLIAFAQAFTQYFITVTDYSFIHTAPRRISVNRGDINKLNEIFNAVMLVKLGLMLACFVLAAIVIFTFARFRGDWNLYFVSFLMVLGNVLFPVWMFQGMEKMKYITVLNLISKLFFTGSIFLAVKDTSDYLYVPLLNSLGLILSGSIALFVVYNKLGVVFKIPSKLQLKVELKDGWHLFLGMFSVNLFSSTNLVILGLFANNTMVGYFRAGDALVRALIGLLQPIVNAIYPHVCRLAGSSKRSAYLFIRKTLLFIAVIGFAIAIVTLIFAEPIVMTVFGKQYRETISVIMILSFLPFISNCSSVLGVQGLLAFNKNVTFSKIVTVSAICNVILAFLLTPVYKHIGISVSLVTTELFTLIVVAFVTRDIFSSKYNTSRGVVG